MRGKVSPVSMPKYGAMRYDFVGIPQAQPTIFRGVKALTECHEGQTLIRGGCFSRWRLDGWPNWLS